MSHTLAHDRFISDDFLRQHHDENMLVVELPEKASFRTRRLAITAFDLDVRQQLAPEAAFYDAALRMSHEYVKAIANVLLPKATSVVL